MRAACNPTRRPHLAARFLESNTMTAPDTAAPGTLAKSFEPKDIEARWYAAWESRGLFAAGTKPDTPAFSIQLPPPNVTGTLHMGHAFNQTLMDALTRYHRMRGSICSPPASRRNSRARSANRVRAGRPA